MLVYPPYSIYKSKKVTFLSPHREPYAMPLNEALPIFELLSYIVTIVGFPLAIGVFYYEHKKSGEDNKIEAFSHSSDRYVEFLTLIVNYPKFDLFPSPQTTANNLSEEELKVESSLLAILIDMFEKAYVLYHDGDRCIHHDQWQGWEECIMSYCNRDNFSREWQLIGSQFDQSFVKCVDELRASAVVENDKTK